MINCTRCQNTGFLNIEQFTEATGKDFFDLEQPHETVLKWIAKNDHHDVQICDCCGDGEGWHGVPGEHYNHEDPRGAFGPYVYNGGLCECN